MFGTVTITRYTLLSAAIKIRVSLARAYRIHRKFELFLLNPRYKRHSGGNKFWFYWRLHLLRHRTAPKRLLNATTSIALAEKWAECCGKMLRAFRAENWRNKQPWISRETVSARLPRFNGRPLVVAVAKATVSEPRIALSRRFHRYHLKHS